MQATKEPATRAYFALRYRCSNCRLTIDTKLQSPDLEDAPSDVEELLESALLSSQPFSCAKCNSQIGLLIRAQKITQRQS